MTKIPIPAIVFIFCVRVCATASDFESRLDEDGSFLNRIRFTSDGKVLGLVLSLSEEGVEFLEPLYKSEQIIAGRLNFKGILRELYSPDSSKAGSSVFQEAGTAAVSASFSRGPRFGAAFYPFETKDFSFWAFHANCGTISCGTAIRDLAVPDNLLPAAVKAETDFVFCAGSSAGSSTSSWFFDHPVLPEQLVLNPSAELRISVGNSSDSGRGMLKPASYGPGAAVSLLGIFCLPRYTPFSAMYRLFGSAGSEICNLRGMFRYTGKNFTGPDGKPVDELLSASMAFFLLFDRPLMDISLDTALGFNIEQSNLQPAKMLPSAETASFSLCIDTGFLKTDAGLGYSRRIDIDGSEYLKADFDTDVKLSWEKIAIETGYNMDIDDLTGPGYEFSHKVNSEVSFIVLEMFSFYIGGGFNKGSTVKIGMKADFGEKNVKLSVAAGPEKEVKISAGFRNTW